MRDMIPESLQQDKTVTTFLRRAAELEHVDAVVSYYCKIYVLEYILTHKLHVENKDNEVFTVQLLDETEAIKNSDDEGLRSVLADKQLSINVVFAFGFKVFTSALEALSEYDGTKEAKGAILTKLRAATNFLTLLDIFTEDEDSAIDYAKLTGGKTPTVGEFKEFVRLKVKIAKFQTSQLIKDKVEVKQPSKEDFDELESELEKLDLPETEVERLDLSETDLPEAPKDEGEDHAPILPGAPTFSPGDESEVHLPGPPKFLPDDDVSTINTSLSITVFPRDGSTSRKSLALAVPTTSAPTPRAHDPKPHQPLTKASITSIIDQTEHISQVQKHAKFAISALNYEDLATAETELTKALQLLHQVKQST